MTEKQKEIVAKHPMVKIYVNQITENDFPIEKVPSLWRSYVEEYLA